VRGSVENAAPFGPIYAFFSIYAFFRSTLFLRPTPDIGPVFSRRCLFSASLRFWFPVADYALHIGDTLSRLSGLAEPSPTLPGHWLYQASRVAA
jgi:hypothetical protein